MKSLRREHLGLRIGGTVPRQPWLGPGRRIFRLYRIYTCTDQVDACAYCLLTLFSSKLESISRMFSRFTEYASGFWSPPVHPRILVKVETSSDKLSLSSTKPFTITLHAVVEGNSPVTIAYRDTILHRHGGARGSALDDQGLTFECTKTGQLAKRPTMNVCYFSTANMQGINDVLEIPPELLGEEPYSISHDLTAQSLCLEAAQHVKILTDEVSRPFDVNPDGLDSEPRGLLVRPHLDSFEVGHTYVIGLGHEMGRVWWWRRGRKRAVFANGPHVIGGLPREGPQLKMVLVTTARFTVVD